MATATQEQGTERRPERRERRQTLEFIGGGSGAEAISGAGAAVLAILALAGVLPDILMPIAAIGIGAALLFKGGAIASRFRRIMERAARDTEQEIELGGGMSAEIIGGVGGVVLGILALVEVAPMTLMAISAIVFGGALMMGTGETARMTDIAIDDASLTRTQRAVARQSINSAAGAQTFVGMGSVALGILALVGMAPQTLVLVALLGVSATLLLSGVAVGGRVFGYLAQH